VREIVEREALGISQWPSGIVRAPSTVSSAGLGALVEGRVSVGSVGRRKALGNVTPSRGRVIAPGVTRPERGRGLRPRAQDAGEMVPSDPS
jgi:hypothetical protein